MVEYIIRKKEKYQKNLIQKMERGNDCKIELSHHYGLERFREFESVSIDCINRGYCKKLILQFPRLKHP